MPISKNRRKKPKKRRSPARRRPLSGDQTQDKTINIGNRAIIYSDNLIDDEEESDDEQQ